MNRFERCLRLPQDNPNLRQLAECFIEAIVETELEQSEPESDPAVMLLGGHIAFRTHADVASLNMYRQLIDHCALIAVERRSQQ